MVEDKSIPQRLSCTPRNLNLLVGESKDVKIQAEPLNASLELEDWRESAWGSEKEVAKIEKKEGEVGVYTVTALKEGRTSFSASSKYTTLISAHLDVTVEGEKVVLDREVAEMTFNDTLQLTARILPETATQIVSWTAYSYDIKYGLTLHDVLTVDNGKITTFNKMGYAKIVATSANGSGESAECLVSVAKEKIESVKVRGTEISRKPNKDSEIEVEIYPEDAMDKLEARVEGDAVRVKDIRKKIGTKNTHICTISTMAEEGDANITMQKYWFM